MTHIDSAKTFTAVAPAAGRRSRSRYLTSDQFLWLLEIFDISLVVAAAYLSHFIRFGNLDVTGVHGMTAILATIMAFIAFRYTKLHDPEVLGNGFRQLSRAAIALALVFGAMIFIGYATKTGDLVSRLWVGIWFLCAMGLFLVTRWATVRVYERNRAAGMFAQRVVICSSLQDLPLLESFLQRWEELPPPNQEIAGIYLDDTDLPQDHHLGKWLPLIRGSIDTLLTDQYDAQIDRAITIVSPGNKSQLDSISQKLRTIAIDVDFMIGEVSKSWSRRPVSMVAGCAVVRAMHKPLTESQVVLKRALDLTVAVLALLFLGPLMTLIALSVKLTSRGPILFRQERHGFNNQPFSVYKFRTMYDRPVEPFQQTSKHDPRVTWVGRFLRRTSLDELPQIFNVLKGDMSIVGPRPHACDHNDQFAEVIDRYLSRHRIKPGITGWAQVNGYRGETDTLEKMQKRVEYDLHYADNWSIKFDLKIIILTFNVLIHPNAY